MARGQASGHACRSAGRDRGKQHRPPSRIALEALLRQQPAHRVPDQDGRLAELLGRPADIVEIVLDPMPDPAGLAVMAPQSHGPYIVAPVGQPGCERVRDQGPTQPPWMRRMAVIRPSE